MLSGVCAHCVVLSQEALADSRAAQSIATAAAAEYMRHTRDLESALVDEMVSVSPGYA